jgi:AraC family transcriptional regulator of arabinose operon
MTEQVTNLFQVNLRTRRGPVVIGDVVYAPGGACGPRTQHDYQLVVLHRGRLELQLDREKIEVPENHAILLHPRHREYFLFTPDGETHHSWCAIDPSAVPPGLRRQWRGCRGPVPFLGAMAALLDVGRLPRPGSAEEEPLQEGFYLGLGLALICDFVTAVRHRKIVDNPVDRALGRLEQFIRHECARPLTLADMARAVGVSRQHLLKLCRIRGKPTAMAQLYTQRLVLSADLLLHTGLAIGEIAERCGFANAFHFSRKFREAYGRSPSAWRSHLWKTSGRASAS